MGVWIGCHRKQNWNLKDQYGALFQADFDVLLYDFTSSYIERTSRE